MTQKPGRTSQPQPSIARLKASSSVSFAPSAKRQSRSWGASLSRSSSCNRSRARASLSRRDVSFATLAKISVSLHYTLLTCLMTPSSQRYVIHQVVDGGLAIATQFCLAVYRACRKITYPHFVMDRRQPPELYGAAVMTSKAQQHFQTIAILSYLDSAERHAMPDQFAAAAKITARAVSIARKRSR